MLSGLLSDSFHVKSATGFAGFLLFSVAYCMS